MHIMVSGGRGDNMITCTSSDTVEQGYTFQRDLSRHYRLIFQKKKWQNKKYMTKTTVVNAPSHLNKFRPHPCIPELI